MLLSLPKRRLQITGAGMTSGSDFGALMRKQLMGEVEPTLTSLKELARVGDVCRLRDTLADLQGWLGGLPAFESLKTTWEAKLGEEPWSSELQAGDDLGAVLRKREASSTTASYLKKLDGYLAKNKDSFYAGAVRAERASVMKGVERSITRLEKMMSSGNVFAFSTELKKEAKRFAGIDAFSRRNAEWPSSRSS
jgi:hypothetical protein